MKKGFTLVELLATIVIIGVVALIAVPSVVDNIKLSKEKLYKTQIQNIEIAAKKWATASADQLDSTYLNSSFVSVIQFGNNCEILSMFFCVISGVSNFGLFIFGLLFPLH